MILTWWELEELLEHFHGREDIWSWDNETGMWLRTDTDSNPLLGLAIRGPNRPGPYRQYKLQCIPLGWDDVRCAEYLEELCVKWTSAGFRRKVVELLTTDDGIRMAPAVAEAVAVAIGKIEQEPAPDPDKLALPSQGELWPDAHGCEIIPSVVERTVRTVGLVGGGWLSIRYQGEMLRIRLSIPALDTGGYEHPYEGFIRPRHGNVAMSAAGLFSYKVKAKMPDVPERDPNLPFQGDSDDVRGQDRAGDHDPGSLRPAGEGPASPVSDEHGSALPPEAGTGEDERGAVEPVGDECDVEHSSRAGA